MKYRASNGITRSPILTEDEAREAYDTAPYVTGAFGEEFTTYPVGEYGRVLSIAATSYVPLKDECETRTEGVQR